MNETTPAKEKQAREAQARATDRAESGAAGQSGVEAPEADELVREPLKGRHDPEAVKEDPTMDEDEHEAHRMTTPTAPLGR